METNSLSEKSVRFLIFRYFFIIFLFIGSILGGTILKLHNLESKDYRFKLELEEQAALELQVGLITHNFAAIISDILYLSRQNELLTLIDDETIGSTKSISKEYLEFSRFKGVYDQIRYLNEKGMEIVRVDYNKGHPFVVKDDQLQFKGERYYFKDSIRLKAQEVFVSPLDLNIEKGKIEQPLKPMIRFGIPVFNTIGQKRGVVLLNYLGKQMLESIKKATKLSGENIMLLNSDGYWFCSPNEQDEWGFMIKDREDKTFPARFPEAWKHISGSQQTQFHTGDGLFTSATIYPFLEGLKSSSGSVDAFGDSQTYLSAKEYYWKIVSHVPAEILKSSANDLVRKLSFLVAFLVIFIAVLSWFLAQAIVKRKSHQLELFRSANFDLLTGLPNRSLFFERVEQTLKQGHRNEKKFALLFLDLDGFKAVNDTLGHDGGDEMLSKVAKKLQSCVRESDTAARLGGDEFAILLTNVISKNDAGLVAEKIIKNLLSPFTIKGKELQIGVSIGIGIFPENGKITDQLLQKADHAMYTAKKEGKNCFRYASD